MSLRRKPADFGVQPRPSTIFSNDNVIDFRDGYLSQFSTQEPTLLAKTDVTDLRRARDGRRVALLREMALPISSFSRTPSPLVEFKTGASGSDEDTDSEIEKTFTPFLRSFTQAVAEYAEGNHDKLTVLQNQHDLRCVKSFEAINDGYDQKLMNVAVPIWEMLNTQILTDNTDMKDFLSSKTSFESNLTCGWCTVEKGTSIIETSEEAASKKFLHSVNTVIDTFFETEFTWTASEYLKKLLQEHDEHEKAREIFSHPLKVDEFIDLCFKDVKHGKTDYFSMTAEQFKNLLHHKVKAFQKDLSRLDGAIPNVGQNIEDMDKEEKQKFEDWQAFSWLFVYTLTGFQKAVQQENDDTSAVHHNQLLSDVRAELQTLTDGNPSSANAAEKSQDSDTRSPSDSQTDEKHSTNDNHSTDKTHPEQTNAALQLIGNLGKGFVEGLGRSAKEIMKLSEHGLVRAQGSGSDLGKISAYALGYLLLSTAENGARASDFALRGAFTTLQLTNAVERIVEKGFNIKALYEHTENGKTVTTNDPSIGTLVLYNFWAKTIHDRYWNGLLRKMESATSKARERSTIVAIIHRSEEKIKEDFQMAADMKKAKENSMIKVQKNKAIKSKDGTTCRFSLSDVQPLIASAHAEITGADAAVSEVHLTGDESDDRLLTKNEIKQFISEALMQETSSVPADNLRASSALETHSVPNPTQQKLTRTREHADALSTLYTRMNMSFD